MFAERGLADACLNQVSGFESYSKGKGKREKGKGKGCSPLVPFEPQDLSAMNALESYESFAILGG